MSALPIATDIATVATSVAAIVLSVIALLSARNATRHADRVARATRVYDGYDALSKLRVEHWEQAHLLELPINYEEAVKTLKVALGQICPRRRDELLLRERAIATRIFTLYEEAWYDLKNAALARGDEERIHFQQEVVTYFSKQLMANPRLQHLWRKDGGNLRVYIHKTARKDYEAELPADAPAPDSAGPYT